MASPFTIVTTFPGVAIWGWEKCGYCTFIPEETCGRDCKSRIAKETCGRDCKSRIAKETYGRDCKSRPAKSGYMGWEKWGYWTFIPDFN